MATARKRDLSQNDIRTVNMFAALRDTVKDLIQAEPQDPETVSDREKIKQFRACVHDLNNAYAWLQAAERPALELTQCQALLATLFKACPNFYNLAYKNPHNRILAGLTHCANTLSFIKKVEDEGSEDLKNNFIIQAITSATALLADPEAAAAINQFGNQFGAEEKKQFLFKLKGHLAAGLQSLAITANLSATGKARLENITQPVIDAINRILNVQNRFRLFQKPLAYAGAAVGFGLAQFYTLGLLEVAVMVCLWSAAGEKTGELADIQLEKCRRNRP